MPRNSITPIDVTMVRIAGGVAFLLPFGDENFFSHVNFDGPLIADRPELGPCWLWTGAITEWKYGLYRFPGMNKNGFAHRYAYAQTYGAITSEELVCHHCDRPACVNPAHLWLGTNLQNARDKIAKGRAVLPPPPRGDTHHFRLRPEMVPRGENHSAAKLTEAQVRLMHQYYAAGGVTQADLAAEFNLQRATVSQILSGKRWRHVYESLR